MSLPHYTSQEIPGEEFSLGKSQLEFIGHGGAAFASSFP